MNEIIDFLFSNAAYVAHGYCLLWQPSLVALHAGSDFLTGIAYLAIPLAMWQFAKRRADLDREAKLIALLFVTFIVLCALSHFANLATLWVPWYGLEGTVMAATATVSVITAFAVWRYLPQALEIPSPAALHTANAALEAEVTSHRETLDAVRRTAAELERRVAERTAELADLNARYELALRDSRISVFSQDRERRFTWAFNLGDIDREAGVLGKPDEAVFDEDLAGQLIPAKETVLKTGERAELEVETGSDGDNRHYRLRLEPHRKADGTVNGLIGAMVDISDVKQEADRKQLLLHELRHRSKNLLVIIGSLARQTARATPDKESFVTAFTHRLQGLAASLDVLVETRWRGADFATLAKAHLGPESGLGVGKLSIDGPPLNLNSDAVQNIGLALHELATNAIKYGAWSVPEGSVSLSWQEAEEDGKSGYRLVWRERGGPPAEIPKRQGFGQALLRSTLVSSLGGKFEPSYEPEGLVCEIWLPRDRIATEAARHATD